MSQQEQIEQVLRSVRDSRQLRPRCTGIDPDSDENGYFCAYCGYELIERGQWFQHGSIWRHPEVWR